MCVWVFVWVGENLNYGELCWKITRLSQLLETCRSYLMSESHLECAPLSDTAKLLSRATGISCWLTLPLLYTPSPSLLGVCDLHWSDSQSTQEWGQSCCWLTMWLCVCVTVWLWDCVTARLWLWDCMCDCDSDYKTVAVWLCDCETVAMWLCDCETVAVTVCMCCSDWVL